LVLRSSSGDLGLGLDVHDRHWLRRAFRLKDRGETFDKRWLSVALAAHAELLPAVSGVTATIVLLIDEHDYATGEGTATTGHSTTIPTETALRWAGGDVRMMAVLRTQLKAVQAYTHLNRYFTQGQRLATAARDLGCSFPGCDVGPNWCESHHITDHAKTGTTGIPDGTLLCGFHHHNFQPTDYRRHMIDGIPTWTQPEHLDRQHHPVRNRAHHLIDRLR
jgi:hypothetical protein